MHRNVLNTIIFFVFFFNYFSKKHLLLINCHPNEKMNVRSVLLAWPGPKVCDITITICIASLRIHLTYAELFNVVERLCEEHCYQQF